MIQSNSDCIIPGNGKEKKEGGGKGPEGPEGPVGSPYTFKVSVPPVGCAAFLFLRADADTPLRRIVSVV
jgi:hypothetical protein